MLYCIVSDNDTFTMVERELQQRFGLASTQYNMYRQGVTILSSDTIASVFSQLGPCVIEIRIRRRGGADTDRQQRTPIIASLLACPQLAANSTVQQLYIKASTDTTKATYVTIGRVDYSTVRAQPVTDRPQFALAEDIDYTRQNPAFLHLHDTNVFAPEHETYIPDINSVVKAFWDTDKYIFMLRDCGDVQDKMGTYKQPSPEYSTIITRHFVRTPVQWNTWTPLTDKDVITFLPHSPRWNVQEQREELLPDTTFTFVFHVITDPVPATPYHRLSTTVHELPQYHSARTMPPSAPSATRHNTRTDLNVRYADKDTVKALGARWDKTGQTWYILGDLNEQQREQLAPWLPRTKTLEVHTLPPAQVLHLTDIWGHVHQQPGFAKNGSIDHLRASTLHRPVLFHIPTCVDQSKSVHTQHITSFYFTSVTQGLALLTAVLADDLNVFTST